MSEEIEAVKAVSLPEIRCEAGEVLAFPSETVKGQDREGAFAEAQVFEAERPVLEGFVAFWGIPRHTAF